MSTTTTTPTVGQSSWQGGKKPFKASWGKLMMWFFLLSDAFTFSTLLVVYGVIRFKTAEPWADPEVVFTHFPAITEFLGGHPPLAFVGLMTFILIASSVTMVLAVEAGHRMDKATVQKYMLWTIAGGVAFLGCQAYEWFNFIMGTEWGGLLLQDGSAGVYLNDAMTQLKINTGANAGTILEGAALVKAELAGTFVDGANLSMNQYSANPSFANLFFFITGFHGSHVASGVLLNFIIYQQVSKGVMHRRGHYEMVEKVGLYWHFVDLVWVFVFTFFYLI